MTVSLGNGVDIGNIVTAETNPLTGGMIFSAGGYQLEDSTDTRPVVCIGGDHPYAQWWGKDGTDGLAGLYKKYGITPYMAINTHSLTGEGVGDAYMMDWSKVKSMSDSRLVEVVAHGARHYQDWECPDAGIAIKYTGVAATATVYITATSIVGVTAGAVDDFAVLFATYPSLKQITEAIDALPNWSSQYSPELTGNELAKNLLTIASGNAKSCKVADTRGARFSAAGGLRVFWDSLVTYIDSCVIYLAPTSLNVCRNGVRIGSFTLSSYTLSSLLTAIKALNTALASSDAASGLPITSLANDSAGYAYCTGEEDASNLGRNLNSTIHFNAKRIPAVITAGGLTPGYLRSRNIALVKETAANNGVNIRNFAQSGGNFFSDITHGISQNTFSQMRGNTRYGVVAPVAMPTNKAKNGFHPHISLKGNYNSDDALTTLVNAIVASPGHMVDLLIHSVVTDAAANDGSMVGSSGFYLDSVAISADIDEPNMVRLLSKLAAARDAGQLRIVTHGELGRVAVTALPPRNLLFNPQIISRTGTTLKVTDNSGKTTCGWKINGFGMQEVNIIDGGLEFVSNGTAANVLTQRVVMDQGGRYRIGARVETENGQATSIQALLAPVYGDWPDAMAGLPLTYAISDAISQAYQEIAWDVEIPTPRGYGHARIVSLTAQPYNLSANKNIQIQMENSAAFDIDCSAGASNTSAVTAKEVASAINAAISASATFAVKPELHSVARAENGYVVLELARRQPYPENNGTLQVNAGSTLSATSLIFGGASAFAWASHGGEDVFSNYPVDVLFKISAPAGVKIKIIAPYVAPRLGVI